MPRAGYTHVLTSANPYTRITPSTETVVTLQKDCVAVMLSAQTASVYCTWDGTTASATNGLPIAAGAQPLYVPLGRLVVNGQLRAFSATGTLNIVQLA